MCSKLMLAFVFVMGFAGCMVGDDEQITGSSGDEAISSLEVTEDNAEVGAATSELIAACVEVCDRQCVNVGGWVDIACWRQCSTVCTPDAVG